MTVKDAQISITDIPYSRVLATVYHLPTPGSTHSLLADSVGPITVSVFYQIELPGTTDTVTYYTSFEAASNCDA